MKKTENKGLVKIPEGLRKIPANDFFLLLKIYGVNISEFNRSINRSRPYLHHYLAEKNIVPVWLLRAFVDYVKQDVEVVEEKYLEELAKRNKAFSNKKKAEG